MKSKKHVLWVEKYRPTNLDDYIFQDSTHKKSFEKMITDQTIPHLLLSGVQGGGKSTIAEILIRGLNIDPTDVLVINASDENSVDIMRDKIKGFIYTFAVGEFKIVQLEEADHLSVPAQAILRKYMEEPNSPARFILTCNYENKILPAIKSRSQQYRFKSSNVDDIAERLAIILIDENIEFDIELLYQYIAVGYPDIRKIINLLQQNTFDNTLQTLTIAAESGDYKFKLLDLITVDNWTEARKIVCENVAKEEWEDLYRFLYENLDKSKKFKTRADWETGIVAIAKYLHRNSIVADQEINTAALFIELSLI